MLARCAGRACPPSSGARPPPGMNGDGSGTGKCCANAGTETANTAAAPSAIAHRLKARTAAIGRWAVWRRESVVVRFVKVTYPKSRARLCKPAQLEFGLRTSSRNQSRSMGKNGRARRPPAKELHPTKPRPRSIADAIADRPKIHREPHTIAGRLGRVHRVMPAVVHVRDEVAVHDSLRRALVHGPATFDRRVARLVASVADRAFVRDRGARHRTHQGE